MKILIANDDGIYSPGISALAHCAAHFGEVVIVAPDVEQSSMGHAITHSRPLRLRRTPAVKGFNAYRVNGTPADCVALGATMHKVDVVLSGINLGLNLGNSMWHSGTLAAAKQATLLGLRGIAFSTPVTDDEPKFDMLAPYVKQVLELLLPDPTLTLVNVNLPPAPHGLVWTRQSVRHYDGGVVRGVDPAGRELHWITVQPIEETDEGTDRWAVEHGLVSMTPLRLDLTDHATLKRASAAHPTEEPATAT